MEKLCITFLTNPQKLHKSLRGYTNGKGKIVFEDFCQKLPDLEHGLPTTSQRQYAFGYGAMHMAWWNEFTAQKSPSVHYYQRHHHEHWWVVLSRALKTFFYHNFLDILYHGLTLFTFSYLAFVIWAFFDQNNIPIVVSRVVDALAEPYLGTLGVYLVVKEIRQRLGKKTHKHMADVIVMAWLMLMLVSSLLTIFSSSYHFNIVYRHIVTNSLAALIIRIGTFLHY